MAKLLSFFFPSLLLLTCFQQSSSSCMVNLSVPLNTSPVQLGLDSNQPPLPVLCGPQVGASRVADRFLQGVGRRENLPWNLALSANGGRVGAQGLGGADEQGSGLRGVLLRGRRSVSRTGPLCAEGSSGSVVDELGKLGLRRSGGSRRGAEGALARG